MMSAAASVILVQAVAAHGCVYRHVAAVREHTHAPVRVLEPLAHSRQHSRHILATSTAHCLQHLCHCSHGHLALCRALFRAALSQQQWQKGVKEGAEVRANNTG
eukprot:10955-Heterococcus_DN1.PRE.2